MELGEKIKHAATVAKWKADQQKRLMESNSLIGRLKNEVRNHKFTMADKALSLYEEEQLSEDELKGICDDILDLEKKIAEQASFQRDIKNEQSPEQHSGSPNIHKESKKMSPERTASLVCPNCSHAVPLGASFCTNCGKTFSSSQENEIDKETKKCSNCGENIPIKAEYCPDCGHQIIQNN